MTAVIVIAGALLLLNETAFAGTQGFVSYINMQRAHHGVRTLPTASDLMSYAYNHSRAMAARQTIYHSTNAQLNSIPGWIGIGENVGMGMSTDDLNQAFMNSPEHRYNILYPNWTQLGIGVAVRDNVIYVTEIFVWRGVVRHHAYHAPPRPHVVKRAPPPKPVAVSVDMTLRAISLGEALLPGEPLTEPNPHRSAPRGSNPNGFVAVQTERPKAGEGDASSSDPGS